MLDAAPVLVVGGTFLGVVLVLVVGEGVVPREEEATKKVAKKIDDIEQL